MASPRKSLIKNSQALSISVLHSSDQDCEHGNLSASILHSSDYEQQLEENPSARVLHSSNQDQGSMSASILQSSDYEQQLEENPSARVLHSSNQDPGSMSASILQSSDYEQQSEEDPSARVLHSSNQDQGSMSASILQSSDYEQQSQKDLSARDLSSSDQDQGPSDFSASTVQISGFILDDKAEEIDKCPSDLPDHIASLTTETFGTQNHTTIKSLEKITEPKQESRAQNPVKMPFSQYTAKLLTEFDVQVPGDTATPKISGSAFLPDSRLLLVDCENTKLMLFNIDYKLVTHKQFSDDPWEVSVYDDNEVAVTILGNGIVRLYVDGDIIKEKGEISPGFNCYGVSYISRDKLAVTGRDWTKDDDILCVYTTAGKQLSRLSLGQGGEIPNHVAVDREKSRAYVSTEGTHTVSAIDLNVGHSLLTFMNTNNIVFTYEHKELSGPAGVTVDKDHNLYVCGSHNIHQVSPEGELIQILLSGEHGVYWPQTVSFTPSGGTLVITVKLYKCTL